VVATGWLQNIRPSLGQCHPHIKSPTPNSNVPLIFPMVKELKRLSLISVKVSS
jgi:hypothetical protein